MRVVFLVGCTVENITMTTSEGSFCEGGKLLIGCRYEIVTLHVYSLNFFPTGHALIGYLGIT